MANVVVTITGDTKKFLDSLKEAGSGVETFGGVAAAATKVVAAGFALVSGAVAYGVSQYREQEVAVNSLNQVLANNNIYSEKLSQSYQDIAKELQKVTLYTDDQIVAAQATIQSFIGQHKISKDLVSATLDLAAAKRIDLGSAAELVGKTLGTETNALQRQGIQFDAHADVTTKLSTLTKALNANMKDQALVAADGTGVFIQLKHSIDDVFKVVGETAMPLLGPFVRQLNDLVNKVADSPKFKEGLQSMFMAFKGVFEGMIGIMKWFVENFDSISAGIKTTWNALFGNSVVGKVIELWRLLREENKKGADALAADNEEESDKESKRQVVNNQSARTDEQKKQDERQQKYIEKYDALVESNKQIETENKLTEEREYEMEAVNHQKELQLKRKNDQQFYDDKKKYNAAYATLNQAMHSEEFQGAKTAFGNMAEFTQSSNQTLKNIGKVAAIANIVIKTAESAMAIFAGFSTIPIIGPALGVAGAAAAVAFGAEQVTKVNSAATGGLLTGGIPGIDSIPLLAMPGELVVPTKNYDEVVNAVADRRGGGAFGGESGFSGQSRVLIGFDGPEASRVLTIRQNEDRALGISQEGT